MSVYYAFPRRFGGDPIELSILLIGETFILDTGLMVAVAELNGRKVALVDELGNRSWYDSDAAAMAYLDLCGAAHVGRVPVLDRIKLQVVGQGALAMAEAAATARKFVAVSCPF